MLLPRGRKGGMPFTMFVLVTPYEGDKTVPELGYCSSYDREYPETKPFGYPFDRHISEYDFNVPNMFWKDVIVFHKNREEINKSNV
ncbi:UNVERIFIED_CONTAM: hypothetical protein B566_EDAN019020 [Ephemera danica]|nr:hypothetical protein B566_EDAN019020 [Ephemera danica]